MNELAAHLRPATEANLGYSIEEASNASGIGRTLLFRAIKQGKLTARKCGRRTIILRDDLARYLEGLPKREVA
jgi:excisionase family DNA binding protein